MHDEYPNEHRNMPVFHMGQQTMNETNDLPAWQEKT